MSRGTTPRNVRVDDDRWNRAKAIADRRGENLSEHVVRPAIDAYIAEHEGGEDHR